jgi:hypothetical protein
MSIVVKPQDQYLLTNLLLRSMESWYNEKISNEQVLKEISEEMIEFEAKIAKWNSNIDNFQTIEEWLDREEELICFRFEVIDAIRRNRG